MQPDTTVYTPPGPRESFASITRIVAVQTAVGLVVALLAWLIAGPVAGSSAIIGVGLCLVPALFFMLRILPGLQQGTEARRIVRGFYSAEALKFGLTALLFIAVFVYVEPLRPDMLFAGFLATHFSMVFAAWVGE
ncbi:MAG: ATP synthase subunit I [Gammaproteobacteria bacterium]|nr:ATP synthase subunit I [Gammaproteobacteria bacterium]NNM21356.1 F0F1 ATP synthase assembly protein I [Gammaproteobacteria bacterium]